MTAQESPKSTEKLLKIVVTEKIAENVIDLSEITEEMSSVADVS